MTGLARICRPKFDLARDVIHDYLIRAYRRSLDTFQMTDLTNKPLDKFFITEKISDIALLPVASVKYQLAYQYGENIVTQVTVKYIMTQRGPILVSRLSSDDNPDLNYYTNELTKYLIELRALKVYG